MALEEAVKFDSISIVEHFLVDERPLYPKFLARLIKIAGAHGSKSSKALPFARDYTGSVLTQVYYVCFRQFLVVIWMLFNT